MAQDADYARLLTSLPTIEEVLDDHASEIGHDLVGYRNHVYRVVTLCRAIAGDSGDLECEILAVEKARLVLGNAVLQDIAAKLEENEPELIEGRESLEEALDRLESIAKVLDTVSRFLEVIGKVVSLV